MKLDFANVLTRSWQIIWKHKVLWIFGILAGFASGRSSGNNGDNNGSNYNSNGNPPPFLDGQFGQWGGQFRELGQQYILILIALCLVIVMLSVVFYALGMMGRIGIIKGVHKVESGAEALAFGEIWSESMPYFWRFFGLNFLIGLAFVVILIPFILVGVFTAGIGFACLVPVICLLIPVGLAVSLILEQAQVAIVLENLSMLDALKRGWEVAKANVGGVIVMALILWVASLFIGFILALPIIIAVLPVLISIPTLENASSIPSSVWITLTCCALYIPILLLLNGILTAYTKTAWALTYMQLTKPVENTPIVPEADA